MTHTASQRFLSHGPIALPARFGNGHSKAKDCPIDLRQTSCGPQQPQRRSPSEYSFLPVNLHLRQGPNVNPSLFYQESDASRQPSSVPTLFSTNRKGVPAHHEHGI